MKKYLQRFFKRPPLRIAGDLLFWGLILLMLIPATRSYIFAGVAKVRALIMPISVEKDAPALSQSDWNWKLTTKEGKTVTLEEYKGEVILINQWATWCPPCRAEMPSLQKLYERLGQQVVFLLVSQEEATVVKNWIDRKSFTFPWYGTSEQAPALLISQSIPATHIIDREGRVVLAKRGAYDWNSARIRKLLERLVNE